MFIDSRQVVSTWTDQYWLREMGSAIWSIYPYLDSDLNSNLLIGLGPMFYYPSTWKVHLAPYLSMPQNYNSSEEIDMYYGTVMSAGYDFPGFNSLDFYTRYIAPNEISSLSLSYNKAFYLDSEFGQIGHNYYPSLGFSLSGGVADLTLDDPENNETYTFGKVTLSSNFFTKIGNLSFISNQVNFFPADSTYEDRITASFNQGISLIPRTLLGLQLTGSTSFGTLKHLDAQNKVSGWDATIEGEPYLLKLRGFLGIPLTNHIETSFFNWVVLQGVNLGLVYEGASAFSSLPGVQAGMQQSAGLELIPFFRTVSDFGFAIAFGLSLNINKIQENPEDMESYLPGFYISMDPISNLFGTTIAY